MSDVMLIIIELVYAIKDVFLNVATTLFTMLPFLAMLIPFLIGVGLASWGLQFYGPAVLVLLNNIYQYLLTMASIITLAGNLIMGFMEVFAPLYNVIMRFIIQIIVLIFNSICPGPFNTSDILNACPLITTWLNYLLIYWSLLGSIIGLYLTFLQTVYQFIGSIICPNGICTGSICALANTNPCNFDITVLTSWLFDVFNYISNVLFQVLRGNFRPINYRYFSIFFRYNQYCNI
jgi:hypothetical protein